MSCHFKFGLVYGVLCHFKHFQLYHSGHFYWWRKPEYTEKKSHRPVTNCQNWHKKICFFKRNSKGQDHNTFTFFCQIVKINAENINFSKRNSKSRDHNTPTFFRQIVKFNVENITVFLRGIQKVGMTIHLLSFAKL